MSGIEALNSEPEIIQNESSEKTDATCACECHRKKTEVSQTTEPETEDESDVEDSVNESPSLYTHVPSTERFLVCFDRIPQFYAETLEDARSQAVTLMAASHDDRSRKYYIEEQDDYNFTLMSTCNLFLINYDTVETVCNIHPVSQIEIRQEDETASDIGTNSDSDTGSDEDSE